MTSEYKDCGKCEGCKRGSGCLEVLAKMNKEKPVTIMGGGCPEYQKEKPIDPIDRPYMKAPKEKPLNEKRGEILETLDKGYWKQGTRKYLVLGVLDMIKQQDKEAVEKAQDDLLEGTYDLDVISKINITFLKRFGEFK